ncbi:MAG: hypothetical protein U0103_00480 [Candidatus Obscuribacterales bacterium]|nr:hypothetical protein [Cyanobacteria bacterium SZAS LIN-5]RTL42641.1 MAG: hypothetical protein EKK48_11685 [Candidatus Melainabacteria bacterium]
MKVRRLETLVALVACLTLANPVFAQNVLRGSAQYSDLNSGGANTSLKRSDVRPSSNAPDSFAPQGDVGEPVFAPASFSVPLMAPPPAPPANPAFGLNAQSESESDFQGQQGVPGLDQQQYAPHALSAQQDQQPRQMSNPNDPDSSPEMKLLWDAWHHRVAEAVFIRYSTMANAGFANSPPIGAIAAYTVSRDGRISNVHLNQKSPNALYNACVIMAIQSLNGNMAILQFPPNSRRMSVEKVGQFTQNYGQQIGFKTVVGDQETIPGRR